MADVSALQAAVGNLNTEVTKIVEEINAQEPSQSEVDAITQDIVAATTTLSSAVTPAEPAQG
jgi:hypothetical protein